MLIIKTKIKFTISLFNHNINDIKYIKCACEEEYFSEATLLKCTLKNIAFFISLHVNILPKVSHIMLRCLASEFCFCFYFCCGFMRLLLFIDLIFSRSFAFEVKDKFPILLFICFLLLAFFIILNKKAFIFILVLFHDVVIFQLLF